MIAFSRKFIESATRITVAVKKNKLIRITANDGSIKINLGCGLSVAKGWYNVDGSLNALIASWPPILQRIFYRASGANRYYSLADYCTLLREHIFVHYDLSYGLPFGDRVAEHVYSSHFLEHLHRDEALKLLSESFRVLKPGGIIRIGIPDLAHAVSLYENGQTEAMLANYFFVEDKGSSFACHKYMYDFELLQKALGKAGFTNVVRCAFRQGRTPDIKTLDNRPDDTLFVEAERPA
jgi:SAM-dependent methyltransferase